MSTQDDLFHPVVELPDEIRDARYRRLVGLDTVKARLRKEATVLADPASVARWAGLHHPRAALGGTVTTLVADRAPLVVFGGDVGSGKSALAESFGCDLARELRVPVYLWRLKLATRGSGLVGEMTALIGSAFDLLRTRAEQARGVDGVRAIQVLVVDEADALVQSREVAQMHHEDRAGVDAFLAGIDTLSGAGLPIVVVLCTNRLGALDPAVRRRAAAIFTFGRPTDEQRREVLTGALAGLGLAGSTLDELVVMTGPGGSGSNAPPFTFSDLTQRLVPSIALEAFPDGPVTDDLVLRVARELRPTPVFADEAGVISAPTDQAGAVGR